MSTAVPMRTLRFLTWKSAALAAAFLALTIFGGASTMAVTSPNVQLSSDAAVPGHAECNDSPDVAIETVPVGTLDANLQELYAQFEGLPGFIDVYYRPSTGIEYRPMFVGEVPQAAYAVETRLPVAFDTIPQYPQPVDPGTTPSVDDIRCVAKIRPGARMGNGCTLSWIFTNGVDRFAGTAGHCVNVGNIVTVDGVVGAIGTVVFSTGSGGVGTDFALIQINPAKFGITTPEMCDWAGPTGVNVGGILGKGIVHTGHGQFIGLVGGLPPRPRVYVGDGYGANSFDWIGGAIGGDSGSAIRLEGATALGGGKALGTVTHSIGFIVGTPTLGFGTTWSRGIALAAAGGFPGLSVETVGYVHVA